MTDPWTVSSARAADLEDGTPVSVIRLTGELDLDARDAVCRAILQAVADHRTRLVMLDLGAVTFLDSEALGAMIEGWNAARFASKGFRVVNATGIVRRVLSVAGVFEV